MIRIREIDHLVLRVADLDSVLRFYCGALGCTVERRQDDIGLVQLRAGRSIVDLVPVNGKLGRAGGAAPGKDARNLDHFCFRVEPFDEPNLRRHLEAQGIEVGPVESRYGAEGEGPSIYLTDPEGNVVELKGPPAGQPVRQTAYKENPMLSIESLQQILDPLFPGLMGVRIVELAPERIVAELTVRPDLCTVGGILHGGASMAFADTLGAVGTILNMPQGKRTTTTDSSTKFVGAARVNATVTGECVALHRGRTTMVWQTSIKSAEGKLCAVVTQTQLVLEA